jgi:hypothetical protein
MLHHWHMTAAAAVCCALLILLLLLLLTCLWLLAFRLPSGLAQNPV